MTERFPWALALVLAALTAVAGFRPVADPDLPWHIMQGGLVLEQGTWVLQDTTSFTVPSAIFVDHPWLGQLVLRGLFSVGGAAALTLYCAVGGFFAALAVAWAAWEYSERRPWVTLLTAALVMPIVSWRLEPRPLLLFLVFTPVSLAIVRRFAYAQGRPAIGYGVGLVALQAVWIHVHGSYVILPVITAIGLVTRARVQGLRPAAMGLAVPAAMGALILAFADPSAHAKLIGNVALGDATRYIAEMRPLRPDQLLPCYVDSILFLDILLVTALVRSIQRKKVALEDVAYLVFGLALTAVAHRFRAAWAILCIPIVARPLAAELESRLFRLVALVATLTTVPILAVSNSTRRPERGFGMGLNRSSFSIDPVDFLEKIGAKGDLLNFYDDGGYVASRLWPDVKIAIDGRTPTVFDDELYFLVRQTMTSSRALGAFERAYAPQMAMPSTSTGLCRMLDADPRWRPVYASASRAVFFLEGFRDDVPSLRGLPPCALLGTVRGGCDRARLSALEADLERLLALTPNAPDLLTVASELAGACYGDVERAVKLSDAAVATGTRRGAIWLASARALASAKLFDEALARAEFASAMGAGVDAEVLEAQILRGSGQKDAARARFAALVDKYADATPPAARMAYAELLAEDGQWGIAKLHAQRVLWVDSSTRARILLEAAP